MVNSHGSSISNYQMFNHHSGTEDLDMNVVQFDAVAQGFAQCACNFLHRQKMTKVFMVWRAGVSDESGLVIIEKDNFCKVHCPSWIIKELPVQGLLRPEWTVVLNDHVLKVRPQFSELRGGSQSCYGWKSMTTPPRFQHWVGANVPLDSSTCIAKCLRLQKMPVSSTWAKTRLWSEVMPARMLKQHSNYTNAQQKTWNANPFHASVHLRQGGEWISEKCAAKAIQSSMWGPE